MIISDDAIIAECLKLPFITVVDSLRLKMIHKQVELDYKISIVLSKCNIHSNIFSIK